MTITFPTEKWGHAESADWWSAGQARRQQVYGAATEMMLELANVKPGSRVLDVAAGCCLGFGRSDLDGVRGRRKLKDRLQI